MLERMKTSKKVVVVVIVASLVVIGLTGNLLFLSSSKPKIMVNNVIIKIPSYNGFFESNSSIFTNVTKGFISSAGSQIEYNFSWKYIGFGAPPNIDSAPCGMFLEQIIATSPGFSVTSVYPQLPVIIQNFSSGYNLKIGLQMPDYAYNGNVSLEFIQTPYG